MTKTLAMFALSLFLVVPFMGVVGMSTNVSVAHAQQLDTEDFFDDDFSSSTGLGQSDLKLTIGNLIRVFLGFLGVVAVIIVLMGGFKWMTASGNEQNVTDAKKMLIAGVIGLAIILSAYAITEFVVEAILTASA